MAGLASGEIVATGGTDRNIFESHLKPWSDVFLRTSSVPIPRFYACVGTLGRIFMEIETKRSRFRHKGRRRSGIS